MSTKQRNHMIPNIHRLVTSELGENYWFNGGAKYAMEALGEPDYDYWFFAGLTGDLFTQHYAYTRSLWDAIDGYPLAETPHRFVKELFGKCGYAAAYVSKRELRENTEMHLNTLTAYIDKGIPIITTMHPCGVYVGYEEYGKVLLYITGDNSQPERITLADAISGQSAFEMEANTQGGWIFVGEKKEAIPLAKLYRETIYSIPQYHNVKTDAYCFGPAAFRAWAADIESGKFNEIKPEVFDTWYHYTNYVCMLATNGSCCHGFLKRAEELNPDMGFLREVSRLYKRTAEMWGGDNHHNDADSLEALGGGFNVTLATLQDVGKRGKIARKTREIAVCMDQVLDILHANPAKQ